jgi:type II secretory pathway component GspD/PulD (secretin)
MTPKLLAALLIAPLAQEPLFSSKLESAFSKTIDVDWNDLQLEAALREIQKRHGFNLIIDRRVDRTFRVRGSVTNARVDELLDMAAKLTGARCLSVGEIVYVAPTKVADRVVAAAVRRAAALSPELRGRLAELRDFSWADDANVSDLAERLVADLGFRLQAELPKDLTLPAESVQAARVIDLLAVILAQADQSFEIDATAPVIRVVELPSDARLTRVIRPPRGRSAELAEEFRRAAKSLDVKQVGASLQIVGPWTAQRELEWYRFRRQTGKLSPKTGSSKSTKKGPNAQEQKYSVTLRNVTVRQFAEKVAQITGEPISIDDQSLEAVNKSALDRLNCIAVDVPLAKLLELALSPAGLRYRRSTDGIVIEAAPAKAKDDESNRKSY